MSDENKVEYERVDEKGDKYKRILVKFNPKFLRGSDFEIEFIPLVMGTGFGKAFVTEIDTMSTIDLYRWSNRQMCLMRGTEADEVGTIIPKQLNLNRAELLTKSYHQGRPVLEPRQIIGRVKRVYENVVETYNRPTASTFNHFLYTGQLGSLPLHDENFNIEGLRREIEDFRYPSKNSSGEMIKRSLVEHLFDTHKTEYAKRAILNFLYVMTMAASTIIKERKKEQ